VRPPRGSPLALAHEEDIADCSHDGTHLEDCARHENQRSRARVYNMYPSAATASVAMPMMAFAAL